MFNYIKELLFISAIFLTSTQFMFIYQFYCNLYTKNSVDPLIRDCQGYRQELNLSRSASFIETAQYKIKNKIQNIQVSKNRTKHCQHFWYYIEFFINQNCYTSYFGGKFKIFINQTKEKRASSVPTEKQVKIKKGHILVEEIYVKEAIIWTCFSR